MLKIKDSVDLKELEKFGFKPKYDENTGEICAYEKKVLKNEYEGLIVTLQETKSKIRIFKSFQGRKVVWKINRYNDYFDIDTLYDLIQAGLVEKVEEER